ncbi:MAG: hypothetical protein K2K00_10390 [Muribaculaceae bacterium]|nr:hypothetical protein [Muribaculaceae bacterium]
MISIAHLFRGITVGIILLLPITLIAGALNPTIEENPYYLLMGEAEKAIAEENYEEAAARLIDAMAVEPDNPGNLLLMTNLGMIYSCLDRDSLALATLDDVNRRAPNMTVALLNRGRVRLKNDMNEGAFEDFSRVIELDSLNSDARYFRGMMALYGGDRTTAETDFSIIKATQPERIRTNAALGALYSLTGRDREAIKYFELLIEKEPTPEYFASLAGCYLAVEELSEAARVINEGLKLYRNDPELYYYRAWLNRDRFRLDDSHADARLAIKYGANPEKVDALYQKRDKKK